MTKVEAAGIVNAKLRLTLLAAQKVIGADDLNAVLYTAGLSRYINQVPEDNINLAVTFEEYALFNTAIEDRYGRGGLGVLRRIGQEMFRFAVNEQSVRLGVAKAALKLMPKHQRVRTILNSMVSAVQNTNPRVHAQVEETESKLVYIEHGCPICRGRESSQPICYLRIGELKEAVRWAAGETYEIRETQCIAQGDAACRFEASEKV